ncbi:triple tyrosine motif-containing protein [Candidatus Eisenbacteria bacterium]|uniref:Triple tyrosine motif-containing protein n=1 Tax=Eiseniibacteriota bacterium TaxID=2212470 RepID=A0ABV6YKA7_UNCEI
MNRRLLMLAVTLMLVCLTPICTIAQIQAPGTPPSFTMPVSESVPSITMPRIDIDAYLVEDENADPDTPYRFGAPTDVAYDLDNSGGWTTFPEGGRIWRLRIVSEGAHSIGLLYASFYMPAGAELYLYNDSKTRLLGAFTSANNKNDGTFATMPLAGDAITLEYYEPAHVTGTGLLSISRVVHDYRNVFGERMDRDFGDSGACNININCDNGAPWQTEKTGAVLILTAGLTRMCSGSLINNTSQDGTPYVLTADHCRTQGDPNPQTWVFVFNYESPGCPSQDGTTAQSISNSTVRAFNADSDFLLLQLSTSVPASYRVYFSGWNRVADAAMNSVCIHHPSGDVKKISFDNDSATSAAYPGCPANSHWKVGEWEKGTTEGGSSGAPLFDQEHRIVGQLHGGSAACNGDEPNDQPDYFGKLALSWANGTNSAERLRDWLDPGSTGATELDGYDPNGVLSELRIADGIDYSYAQGDVQPFGDHAVRLSESVFDGGTVWYWFDIGLEPLEDGMQVGIFYEDIAWFGGGPSLYVWSRALEDYELIRGECGQGNGYNWVWGTLEDSDNYVNYSGRVYMKVYADYREDTRLDVVGLIFDQMEGAPGAPILASPPNGEVCVACNPANFDWGDVATAFEYEIEVVPGGTFSTPSSNYSTHLDENTAHTWKVRAANESGWGDWSDTWSFTTTGEPDPPNLITPLNGASDVPYDPTHFDWTDEAYAIGYEVNVNPGGTYWSPSSAYDLYLSPETYHTWKVRAQGDCGWGDWSSTWDFVTAPPPDETPPDTWIVSGPSGLIDYDDVTFTWSGSDNVTPTGSLQYSYWLQGYDPSWSGWTSSTSRSYQDLPEGSYTFRVKARDEALNEDPTPAERSFTIELPGCGPPVLASPANGSICITAPIHLCWQTLGCAVMYEVQLGSVCGLGYTHSTTDLCYEIVDLDPGTTYHWRARAKNDQEEWGEWSGCWSFETEPAMLPGLPSLTSPPCGDTIDTLQTSVLLDWDVAGATSYELQYGLEDDCATGTLVYPPESQYSLDLSGFQVGDVIWWKVLGRDVCDRPGPWSECCYFYYGQVGGRFVRGDTDANGEVNITDPIYSLCFQFADCAPPPCLDAADWDDSGEPNITDPILSLSYQFSTGAPPSAPYPDCGTDPTPDDFLSCEEFTPCGSRTKGAAEKIASASIDDTPIDGRIHLNPVFISEDNTVLVEISVENARDLWGLEFSLEYDPSCMQFETLEHRGLVGESFDFFSCSVNTELGTIRAGAIPDIGLEHPLAAGEHTLAQLRFAVPRGTTIQSCGIKLMGGLLVNTDQITSRVVGEREELIPVVGELGLVGRVELAPGIHFPSPLRPNSPITLGIEQESHARVEIYDVHGRRISTLIDHVLGAGHHQIVWDGYTNQGGEASSGIYYIRYALDGKISSKKVLLAR